MVSFALSAGELVLLLLAHEAQASGSRFQFTS